MSVGLNSIPAWLRPYFSLSNGERNRASLARALRPGAVLDDFGNQMDAPSAACMAACVGRFIRRRSNYRRVVIATSHARVARWLQPDWILSLTPDGATLIERPAAAPACRDPTVQVRPIDEADADLELGREQDRAPPRPRVLTLDALDAADAARRERELLSAGAATRPARSQRYATDPSSARALEGSVA